MEEKLVLFQRMVKYVSVLYKIKPSLCSLSTLWDVGLELIVATKTLYGEVTLEWSMVGNVVAILD